MYEIIKSECMKSKELNPVLLAVSLMKNEEISIHGPVHHILDGAAFLTAMHNAGVPFDLASALDEMSERGYKMPGATCGKWGMCGSASSVGAALSILNKTGPLNDNSDYQNNLLLVSTALNEIAKIGGPRCCKRNAFLSISTAVDFVREKYNITLPQSKIRCEFSAKNQQCIKERCPFYSNIQRRL